MQKETQIFRVKNRLDWGCFRLVFLRLTADDELFGFVDNGLSFWGCFFCIMRLPLDLHMLLYNHEGIILIRFPGVLLSVRTI